MTNLSHPNHRCSRIAASVAISLGLCTTAGQGFAQCIQIESPLYGDVTPNPVVKQQSLDELMQRLSRPSPIDLSGLPTHPQGPSAAGIAMPINYSADAAPLDATSVYSKTVGSVLFVVAQTSEMISQGSAVAISPFAALTNCHVVMTGAGDEKDPGFRYTSNIADIQIRTVSGAEGRAKIIASHPDIDICVIQSLDLRLAPVSGVARFNEVKVGEKVYSLGNPRGQEFSITEGIVSAKRDARHLSHGVSSDLVQFSAPISPGSSGGALFDASGRLVGIVQSEIIDAQNMNLAIPADQLWRSHPDR